MPVGTIHEDDPVVVGELGCSMGEESCHQRGVDPRQDQRRQRAIEWTHSHVGVDVLTDDLVANDGA